MDGYDFLIRVRSPSQGWHEKRGNDHVGKGTHQFVGALLNSKNAAGWEFVGQFIGLEVLAGGLVEGLDDGVFFGESGLSPVGGLGEDGEGRESKEEEVGEIVHDPFLASSVGFGGRCVGAEKSGEGCWLGQEDGR